MPDKSQSMMKPTADCMCPLDSGRVCRETCAAHWGYFNGCVFVALAGLTAANMSMDFAEYVTKRQQQRQAQQAPQKEQGEV